MQPVEAVSPCALCCPAARVDAGRGGAAPPASGDLPVRIEVDSPKPGETVQNKVHQAPIRGTAVAAGERPALFDVMLVIDISGSTKVASGVDVDGDGEVGINPQFELLPPGTYPADTVSTDPGDTILAAEVAAADALIASLDRTAASASASSPSPAR